MSVYKPGKAAMSEAVDFMKEWDPNLLAVNWGTIWAILAMLMDCSPRETRPQQVDRESILRAQKILNDWEAGIQLDEPILLTAAQRKFFIERIGPVLAGLDWNIFRGAANGFEQKFLQSKERCAALFCFTVKNYFSSSFSASSFSDTTFDDPSSASVTP